MGYLRLFRDYRVDVFRFHLFCIRQELFMMAARGEIAFGHSAYDLMRRMMNGNIRFAHRHGLASLLIASLAAPKNTTTFKGRMREATSNLPPEVRKELDFLLL